MTNLVNTLQLELTCGSEEEAFGLRHHLSPVLQQQVVSAIEHAVGQMDDPSAVVVIEKLEIDLGMINSIPDKVLMSEMIRSQVTGQLQPFLASKPGNEKLIVQQQRSADILRHFMLTGTLPWWASSLQPEISELVIETINTDKTWFVNFLQENNTDTRFWRRLMFQLNTEAKAMIVDVVDEIKKGLALAKELIDKQTKNSNSVVGKIDEKKIHAIEHHTETVLIVSENDLTDVLLIESPLLLRLGVAGITYDVIRSILQKSNIFLGEGSFRTIGGSSSDDISQDGNNKTGIIHGTEDRVTETTGELATTTTLPVVGDDIATGTSDNLIKTTGKYYVRNAGIILLAPYLKIFFARLKLLEQQQWKDITSCYKAVHLLRYLSSGETISAEYDLLFEKVICGLAPGMPVPMESGLQQQEITEADELLKSVITHWKKLGNTSIDGLRESFLKREGLLSVKEKDWELKVEKKTVDVLLESMPWGYSAVSLPWNDYIIFTEW